jgi:hypothetical protein
VPALSPACAAIRADGLSLSNCQLSAKQVARFHASYAIMQKAHMDALKIRAKEKSKPAGKASAAAATPA